MAEKFVLPTEPQFERIARAVRKSENAVEKRNAIDTTSPGTTWTQLLPGHNSSSFQMPPYCVGRICGGSILGTLPNATRTVSFDRPSTAHFGRDYCVNGCEPIGCESDKYNGKPAWGQVYVAGPCIVQYQGTDPIPGDKLGPVPGKWYVEANRPSIFTVWGVVDTTHKLAYGVLHPIREPICVATVEAPAFGVAAITGVTGTMPNVVPQVGQPSTTYCKGYLVVAGTEIAANKIGAYQECLMVKALYGSGTPAVGEVWGPTASAWTLSKNSGVGCGWGILVAGIYDAG
ncbi:MAG: hypothetical protein WC390_11335, partial [Sulfurimonas sp.]